MEYYVSLIYIGQYSATNRSLTALPRPPAAPFNCLSLVYILVYLGRYSFANRSWPSATPCNWLSLVYLSRTWRREMFGEGRIGEDCSKISCLCLFCVPNHPSFIYSNNKADSNVKGCFDAHFLPWSDAISKTLNEQGVEFVEDLKILNRAVFSHLLMDKNPIVKTRADIAWKELGGHETFQFQKVASSIPIKYAPTPLPKM